MGLLRCGWLSQRRKCFVDVNSAVGNDRDESLVWQRLKDNVFVFGDKEMGLDVVYTRIMNIQSLGTLLNALEQMKILKPKFVKRTLSVVVNMMYGKDLFFRIHEEK